VAERTKMDVEVAVAGVPVLVFAVGEDGTVAVIEPAGVIVIALVAVRVTVGTPVLVGVGLIFLVLVGFGVTLTALNGWLAEETRCACTGVKRELIIMSSPNKKLSAAGFNLNI